MITRAVNKELEIDEYDVLVREKVDEKTFYDYLRFLNSLFKNATLKPAIALGSKSVVTAMKNRTGSDRLYLYQ